MDFSTHPRPSRSVWPGGLLVLCAVLAAGAGLEARQALEARRVARAEMDALRNELASAQRRLATLESGRQQEGERLAARARLTVEVPPHRVLAELAALLPPGVRLSELGLSYERQLLLDAQLVARRPADYDAFLDRLASSPRFADVLPGPESRDGELRASLRASYRGEATP